MIYFLCYNEKERGKIDSMKLVEFIIKTMGPKKMLGSEKGFKRALELKKREVKHKLPNIKFKTKVEKIDIDGHDVYHFKNRKSNKVIIFIHGGAYVSEASFFHYRLVDKICKESNAEVYFPIYPLAPNHIYKESYDLMLSLYKRLLGNNKEIIIMGDSAGGGFSLAFTQYLNELNIECPAKLILI